MERRSNTSKNLYLIGSYTNQIVGHKLPSNIQVLRVLFFNLREVQLNLRDSARLVMDEAIVFWQKARIPTRDLQHCMSKLESLYDKWKNLQKHVNRHTENERSKRKMFVEIFDDLFDIAHANALEMVPEEGKIFLLAQREKGRRGSLVGVDRGAVTKEKAVARQLEIKEERKKRCYEEMQALSTENISTF